MRKLITVLTETSSLVAIGTVEIAAVIAHRENVFCDYSVESIPSGEIIKVQLALFERTLELLHKRILTLVSLLAQASEANPSSLFLERFDWAENHLSEAGTIPVPEKHPVRHWYHIFRQQYRREGLVIIMDGLCTDAYALQKKLSEIVVEASQTRLTSQTLAGTALIPRTNILAHDWKIIHQKVRALYILLNRIDAVLHDDPCTV